MKMIHNGSYTNIWRESNCKMKCSDHVYGICVCGMFHIRFTITKIKNLEIEFLIEQNAK